MSKKSNSEPFFAALNALEESGKEFRHAFLMLVGAVDTALDLGLVDEKISDKLRSANERLKKASLSN